MRPIRSLLIYLVVVFLGGALLAPVLFWVVQSVAPESGLAHSPFHRFVNRAILTLALVGMWPLFKGVGITSRREAGIVKPGGQWHRLGAGFLLGFGSLACVAVVALLAHGRRFNVELTGSQFAGRLASAVLTAVIVAVVEELLFRGAIFGSLRKVLDWRAALVLSSMIYAIVHFMESADLAGPVGWGSGLEILPRMLRGFGNLEVVIPGFFNLTLAGMLLGLAYQRTGNLYLSMGLHAGWIFWLKSYGLTTVSVAGANQWLWGSQKLIDGWFALVVLALVLVVLLRILPKKREGSSA